MNQTKELTTISEKISRTLLEEYNGLKIYYQYEIETPQATPDLVSFYTQSDTPRSLSGSYRKGGTLYLNGQNITTVEDLEVAYVIFENILNLTGTQQTRLDTETADSTDEKTD